MNIIKDKKNKNEYGFDVRVKSRAGIRSFLMYNLLKYIIVLCGCMGIAELYSSGFGIMFDRQVYTAVLLFLVFFVPLSEYIWARIPVYVLSAVLACKELTEHKAMYKSALKGIMNISYGIIGGSFNFPDVDGFKNAAANGGAEISFLAMLLCVLLAVVLTVVVRYRAAAVMTAIMAAAVCGCLFMGGSGSLLSYALIFTSVFGIYMLKRGYGRVPFFRKKYAKRVRIAPFGYEVMLPVIMCFLMLGAVYLGDYVTEKNSAQTDVKSTQNTIEATMKRTVTDTAAMWFSNYKKNAQMNYADGGQLAFYNSMAVGKGTRLKLNVVPFTEDKLFFKFYTGSLYEYGTNQWQTAAADDGSYVQNQKNALAASGAEHDSITLILNSSIDRSFDGYFCTSPNVVYQSDDVFTTTADEENKVTFDIYDKSNCTQSDEYRQFVHDNYLYVSDENAEVIKAICDEKGFQNNGELLGKLQSWFYNDFQFAYDTEFTPFGKDYVNYFLTESKQGNFVHCATAAALLYRYLGVPARYAVGYAVPFEQIMAAKDTNEEAELTERSLYYKQKNVSVTDENLYAWVEIYDDEYGWMPADVVGTVFDELAKQSAEESTEETTETTEATTSKSSSEMIKDYFGNAADEKTAEIALAAQNSKTGAESAAKKVICLIAACALALVLIRVIISLAVYAFAGGNKKADIIFTRLSKYTGVHSGIRDVCEKLEVWGVDAELTNYIYSVISKAEYSGKEISKSDVKKLQKTYVKVVKNTFFKKRKRCGR